LILRVKFSKTLVRKQVLRFFSVSVIPTNLDGTRQNGHQMDTKWTPNGHQGSHRILILCGYSKVSAEAEAACTGKVARVIKSAFPNQSERAEIEITEAEDHYRKVRI
jgi:hypothetical protein